MIRVKICGNRSLEDAMQSVEAGADAIGLIVGIRHLSEDALEERKASNILDKIPPFVTTVLVTHQVDAASVLRLHREVPTTTIQLHDVIKVSEILRIKEALPHVKIIKGIHVLNEDSIGIAQQYDEIVDALLLDSAAPNRIGGTGTVHDWSISKRIVKAVKKPVILAGGLNPHNVQEAIAMVEPFGVDVNSGVDLPNGDKDPDKVRQFISAAKSASI